MNYGLLSNIKPLFSFNTFKPSTYTHAYLGLIPNILRHYNIITMEPITIQILKGHCKSCKPCQTCLKKPDGIYCSRSGHDTDRKITITKKTRKTCETNFAEFIVAAVFKNNGIVTKEDLLTKVDTITGDCSGYIKDLECRDTKDIENLIKSVNSHKDKFPSEKIKKVYLIGKSFKSFPELVKLNEGLNGKEAKSDVYLEMTNETWVGISVKAQKNATKTNYSVEKILPNGKELSKIRKEELVKAGYPKHDPAKRPEVNALFYPGVKNPYFELLSESIQENKLLIIKQLLNGLFPKVPYPIYEFDGEKCINLKTEYAHINPENIELKKVEYPEKKAAKLWYNFNLKDGDGDVVKTLYHIEVRWKGYIHNASPQFQTHA